MVTLHTAISATGGSCYNDFCYRNHDRVSLLKAGFGILAILAWVWTVVETTLAAYKCDTAGRGLDTIGTNSDVWRWALSTVVVWAFAPCALGWYAMTHLGS